MAVLFGIGLYYWIISKYEDVKEALLSDLKMFNKLQKIAKKLSTKGNGEDKFLRQIAIWLDITAPI